MDKIIYIPTAILGLILIIYYTIQCARGKRQFDQEIITNSILQSSGIVGGMLLILSTFFPELKKYLNNLDIYVLISGLAVMASSCQSVIKEIVKQEKNSNN